MDAESGTFLLSLNVGTLLLPGSVIKGCLSAPGIDPPKAPSLDGCRLSAVKPVLDGNPQPLFGRKTHPTRNLVPRTPTRSCRSVSGRHHYELHAQITDFCFLLHVYSVSEDAVAVND